MKKKYFLLSCLVVLVATSFAQDVMNTLKIRLIDKEYDKMILQMHMGRGRYAHIYGESPDSVNWTFVYSDSIYERSSIMEFLIPEESGSYRSSSILINEDGGDRGVGAIGAVKNVSYVLKYLGSSVGRSSPSAPPMYTSDRFRIENLKPEQYGSLYYAYCYFSPKSGTKQLSTKDEIVERYRELAKMYPDCHSFMVLLSETMSSFRSKEEVRSIYTCFSDSLRNTYAGRKIQKYLATEYFKNRMLPNAKTGIPEWIVMDSTKYNLVVFSASWCQPCHEIIPILKQMYDDLGDGLVITYVSVDKTKTIDKWNELMEAQNIPWRSLLAADCVETIYDEYMFSGIPHMFFIYPDGKMRPLEVRQEADKEIIYKSVKKQK